MLRNRSTRIRHRRRSNSQRAFAATIFIEDHAVKIDASQAIVHNAAVMATWQIAILPRAPQHWRATPTVKEAVAEWRRQRREVFVPLTYRPGDLAEVDFFEVPVDVAGTRRKAWLFLMRLMYSGRDFAWVRSTGPNQFLGRPCAGVYPLRWCPCPRCVRQGLA